MTTKLYETRIRSLLAIGLLAAILAQQNAMAQTTPPPEGTVNSPGSVLHGRTTRVADAILSQLPSITEYNQVTNLVQLSSITNLNLASQSLSSLQINDFAGLSQLETLNLNNNQLTNLPSVVFDDLANLQRLSLHNNRLASLPSGVFDKFANLQCLTLSNNRLSSLAEGVFDKLVNLDTLDLARNGISALPAGVFDQLANLETLRLQNNRLASLPDGIFDRLMNLRNEVELSGNPLSIEISLSPTILEVAEGNAGTTNANLQVRISQAYAEAITVRYTTQDGTATSGLDYTTTSGMLTFPAGTTSLTQTISIPIRGDTLDEPPSKSFRLILSNPNNAVFPNNANTLQSTITILDDNPVCRPVPAEFSLPSLIFSADRLTISEGQTAIYQVRGTTLLPDGMIIHIQTSHPQLTIEPQTLVFAPTNWMNF